MDANFSPHGERQGHQARRGPVLGCAGSRRLPLHRQGFEPVAARRDGCGFEEVRGGRGRDRRKAGEVGGDRVGTGAVRVPVGGLALASTCASVRSGFPERPRESLAPSPLGPSPSDPVRAGRRRAASGLGLSWFGFPETMGQCDTAADAIAPESKGGDVSDPASLQQARVTRTSGSGVVPSRKDRTCLGGSARGGRKQRSHPG